jgi:MurNAc alpha-1-phosphate uridylyltransferase|tara:strand:- start:1393 stop:2109 length:717 start_codon:yes stop_codon:yes gene_type:complete
VKKEPMNAMILAAGLGLRMRPLTNVTPKPLLKVDGITMIDRMLTHLQEGKIKTVVINTHYMAEKVAAHFKKQTGLHIQLLHETQLLDTGGGVANALPTLDGNSFIVTNSDVIIISGNRPLMTRMIQAWNPKIMDALLLVQPITKSFGFSGQGDFHMDANGLLQRRAKASSAPFVFTGVQILKRSLFHSLPAEPFSLNLLYNRAQKNERLFGLLHDGHWIHVGTPEAIVNAEAYLRGLK